MTQQVSNRRGWSAVWLAMAALACTLALSCSAALAQEDPFGAAGPKPPPGAEAAKKPEPAPDPAQRDPLTIELVRNSNPATPPELLRAARIALNYGRPDESKRYLGKLLADMPADDLLAPLAGRYADFLLAATHSPDVQPEGQQAAELVLAAAQRKAENVADLQAAIAQLSDSRPAIQKAALQRLLSARAAAANPLLNVLADSSRAPEHAGVRAALVELGANLEVPLVAALSATDERLLVQLVAVLGRMRSRHATSRLIRLAFDPASSAELRQLAAAALARGSGAVPDLYEADKYLRREISQLLAGELPYLKDADDRAAVWLWDEAQCQIAAMDLPSRDAGLLLAARVASDLVALKADDPTARQLMLLTNLEWAKVSSGLDRPLPLSDGTAGAMARAAGPAAINQVLSAALAQGRVPAAIAACELLAASGDPSVLAADNGFSPLAEAVAFPDRRVRMAAALAAVRLAPNESYPGAGRVSQALAWLADGGRNNAVLVGHPRGEDAQSLVGLLNGLGYEGEAVFSGRAVAERAFANPDFQFLLITDAIDSPPVEELVQWLRRDFRTAHIPVGVLARGERLDALRDALANDRFTLVLPRIHSPEVAARSLDDLLRLAGRNLVNRDERTAQALASLAALTMLAQTPGNLARYELLRHESRIAQALNQPALAQSAIALLGVLGTPAAQSTLIDFASQDSRPLADRQAAAAGFAQAVKTRGLRLTQQQIAAQYARYNASQRQDQATQDLLGSILDTIEGPAILRGELSRRE